MYQSSCVHCPPGLVNAIGVDLDSAVAVPIVAVGIDSGPIAAEIAPVPIVVAVVDPTVVAVAAAPTVVEVGTVLDPTAAELEIAAATSCVERLGAEQQLQLR